MKLYSVKRFSKRYHRVELGKEEALGGMGVDGWGINLTAVGKERYYTMHLDWSDWQKLREFVEANEGKYNQKFEVKI